MDNDLWTLRLVEGALVCAGGGAQGVGTFDIAAMRRNHNGRLVACWGNGAAVLSGGGLRPAPPSATEPDTPPRARLPYGIGMSGEWIYLLNRDRHPLFKRNVAGGPAVCVAGTEERGACATNAYFFGDMDPPWNSDAAGLLSRAYCEHVLVEFCAGRPVFERRDGDGHRVALDPALAIANSPFADDCKYFPKNPLFFRDFARRSYLQRRRDATLACGIATGAQGLHKWPDTRRGVGWLQESSAAFDGTRARARAKVRPAAWLVSVHLPGPHEVLDLEQTGAIPNGRVNELGVTDDEMDVAHTHCKHIMAWGEVAFMAGLIDVYEVLMQFNSPRHMAAFDWTMRYEGAERGLTVVAQDDNEDGEYSRSLWFQRPAL